jgi:SAM-dependent methyltransferase
MSGRKRWSRRILVLFGLGGIIGALRLRGRLAALAVVEPGLSQRPIGEDVPEDDGWVLLTAEGVHVDAVTRRDAVAHAEREGLDALDLVPGDLASERAMDLARLVDPATFRSDRHAAGRGAQHALLVRRTVLERAELADEPTSELDPITFAERLQVVKRYAPTATDLAVAPVLPASSAVDDVDKRLAYLRSMFGPTTSAVLGLPAVAYVVIGAGLVVNPAWGAFALVAWSAAPAIATAGTPLQPRDLPVHALRRIVDGPRSWVQTLLGRWRPPTEAGDPVEDLRPVYAELVADGIERFFEPRRDDCPWCGSEELSVRISTTDRYQFKPGTFTLEECATCGHTFQNPRLSVEGLDYYYRDFYDGISDDKFEVIFSWGAGLEHDRARMVEGLHEPKRWLDVGTGHGHFALLAAEVWPDTVFEGLDLGESVAEAERRGWIAKAHRGFLPDLAGELEGQFDVVSMHHELEHTRDPRAEIAAAAKVLAPGGFLEIEVPDPEFPLSRVLGERWLPFFQPQHQHLVTLGNLTSELEGLGFDVLRVVRGDAHRAVDVVSAAWFVVNGAAPQDDLPWLERGSPRVGLQRLVTFALGLPLLALAALADQVVGLWVKQADRGNAYRVLAQKRR